MFVCVVWIGGVRKTDKAILNFKGRVTVQPTARLVLPAE